MFITWIKDTTGPFHPVPGHIFTMRTEKFQMILTTFITCQIIMVNAIKYILLVIQYISSVITLTERACLVFMKLKKPELI